MKKLIVPMILVACLAGCVKEDINVDVKDPFVQSIAHAAILVYCDKNENSIEYILMLDKLLQGTTYDANTGKYTLAEFKNELVKELSEGKTKEEKKEIILTVELVFMALNQQFNTIDSDLIEPYYFEALTTVVHNAAEILKLYEGIE